MITVVREGIYNTGISATGFSASNFFYDQAPQGTSKPYCVYSLLANPYDFDSKNVYEMFHIQFSFFGDVLDTLEGLVNNIKAKFDFGRSNITITGYNVIQSVREFLSLSNLNETDTYQIVMQYKIEIKIAR